MRHFRWFLNHVCPGPLNKNASPTKVTVLEEMIRMMYVSVLVVHLRVWRSLLTDFSLRKLMTLPIGTKILDKYSRFFLLSVQLFPFHPTKCHTAKISILQTDWLYLDFSRQIFARWRKPWFFNGLIIILAAKRIYRLSSLQSSSSSANRRFFAQKLLKIIKRAYQFPQCLVLKINFSLGPETIYIVSKAIIRCLFFAGIYWFYTLITPIDCCYSCRVLLGSFIELCTKYGWSVLFATLASLAFKNFSVFFKMINDHLQRSKSNISLLHFMQIEAVWVFKERKSFVNLFWTLFDPSWSVLCTTWKISASVA